jgi:hypothetical protein
MKIELRKDPITGELFTPHRLNQIYINSKTRIKFNNLKARSIRNEIAYINKPLLKNLTIVKELLKEKTEGEYHKQFLIGKGYSFGVHTHVIKFEDKSHFALYNFIIIPLASDAIKIIKQ